MQIVTTGDRPGFSSAELSGEWPLFVLKDPVSNQYREAVQRYFPQYDVLVVDGDDVLANAVAVALRWDGSVAGLPEGGYDGAIVRSVREHESGVEPDTLCVLAATVHGDRAGQGLAGVVLTALRERAVSHGLHRVVVPVRPMLKASYPLTSMADFATWTREDGLHLDPWIRTHQRLGATIVGPAERSMVVTGTAAEWQKWTGMRFPQSGEYVVPGGLDLVRFQDGQGVYEETNLWMRHL
ncbi:Long-chain-fatty-acid--CoA ligase [Lentzea guizhouensis]|uniref:Long-chain-fatty-acid--CoA ligase n=1 Tax=Lentzea guizhouensis TaxID=1586287 RepID=UPI001C54DBB9|nr:Long-chain-fatty-acid--CoA ligase [Lentzea guizhouensis]